MEDLSCALEYLDAHFAECIAPSDFSSNDTLVRLLKMYLSAILPIYHCQKFLIEDSKGDAKPIKYGDLRDKIVAALMVPKSMYAHCYMSILFHASSLTEETLKTRAENLRLELDKDIVSLKS